MIDEKTPDVTLWHWRWWPCSPLVGQLSGKLRHTLGRWLRMRRGLGAARRHLAGALHRVHLHRSRPQLAQRHRRRRCARLWAGGHCLPTSGKTLRRREAQPFRPAARDVRRAVAHRRYLAPEHRRRHLRGSRGALRGMRPCGPHFGMGRALLRRAPAQAGSGDRSRHVRRRGALPDCRAAPRPALLRRRARARTHLPVPRHDHRPLPRSRR